MGYDLKIAVDPLKIDEQQYALMKTKIKFTKMTSCVGIIVKTGKWLSAFHLVEKAKDKQNTRFDANTAARILHIIVHLPVPKVDKIYCVGHWSSWNNSVPAYKQLISDLTSKDIDIENHFDCDGDGTFKAEVDGETVAVSEA